MPNVPASSLIVILAAACLAGVLLFYRPLTGASVWRATVTPLASIMGSGFLVCAPLLYANVGNYAVVAMIGLLALAYCVGAVIRFNFRHAEPLLETACPVQSPEREEHRLHKAHCAAGSRVQAGEAAQLLEKASYFALAGAYCISVSYYLQLLASFALQPLGSLSPLWGKGLVTLILVGIGAVGLLRGLKGIERVERVVVGINLAMIGALVAGLLYHNLLLAGEGSWRLTRYYAPVAQVFEFRQVVEPRGLK